MPTFSIIVPVLDEAAGIVACLEALAPLRDAGATVIVVDGGSRDATRALAAPLADRVVDAPRGRASQMNAGARETAADILVFLHADTTLPASALRAIESGLARTGRDWGRFDATIAGADPMLALVALLMNARSRLTGVATGDQAIFVRREAFEAVGGFPEIPLMEDVAICKLLLRRTRPLALEDRVITSGRRWERHGTLRTIFLMWRLRLAYAFGADPRQLARRYDA
ncbi:MAG TPA: TIGR04283 family arsenosugar biosynthesis glycosyltransferase [Usitatibacter sp.]|jgi:rSAM/selenodomain-associated transferase 2|nr:TIGR04283 family arsenosugar biosynthesis glycosyltransferase [Usitatibacter sp.]